MRPWGEARRCLGALVGGCGCGRGPRGGSLAEEVGEVEEEEEEEGEEGEEEEEDEKKKAKIAASSPARTLSPS